MSVNTVTDAIIAGYDAMRQCSCRYGKELGTCIGCGEEVYDTEEFRTVTDGLIHEECLEEYVNDLWRDMTAYEKISLFDDMGVL